MSNYFGKAPASKIARAQVIALTGDGASTPSTTFGQSTFQIRVASTLTGWLHIGDVSGTGNSTAVATANADTLINAGVAGECFAVTPGQMAAFLSTSTSMGYCSIVELS